MSALIPKSNRETAARASSERAWFRPMLNFPRWALRLIIAYAFVRVLLAPWVQTDAEELRTYSNDAAGYSVNYPANWYPAPAFYSNAFEIRNYDASHSVTEKDQAAIIINEEATVSPEQAEKRIQSLVWAASKGSSFRLETVPIGQQWLYQWTVIEPAAIPAGLPTKEKPVPSARKRVRVASAVIVGARIVRMEGTAWEDADPEVITSMKAITRSIKLTSKKGEPK